jgi:hypothetical protein
MPMKKIPKSLTIYPHDAQYSPPASPPEDSPSELGVYPKSGINENSGTILAPGLDGGDHVLV